MQYNFVLLDKAMKSQVNGIIKSLLNSKNLNEYEWDFINGIANQLNKWKLKGITRKQYNSLWTIYKERVLNKKKR